MYKTLTTNRHKRLIAALIKARQDAGMTQTELAKRIGEYQSFVARMESGQRRIDFIELLQITEILGVDLNGLVKTVTETDNAK